MNSRYGAAPTHTPPKPSSMPLTRFNPSKNTVFLSNLPSPSVSSKITILSPSLRSGMTRPGVGCRRGYVYASTTHSRPRSSMHMAIGWCRSGSPANRLTLNPSGTVIALAASCGGSPAYL